MNKHERPVKPGTIDKRIARREANAQKKPWPLHHIHRFNKGLHLRGRGQHPSDEQ